MKQLKKKLITSKLAFNPLADQFEKFILDLNDFEINLFCNLLKISLEKIPIIYHNELLLTFIILELVSRLNKKLKKEKIKIFSLDKKFNEHIQGYDVNFRVDCILIFDNKLFIFENKFRIDRINQSKNAIKCIEFKRYSERTLNYLRAYYKNTFEKISIVYEIGLAFSKIKDSISTCIDYKIFDKSSLNLESHKTVDFAIAMRKNFKRFIKICEDNNL